MNIFDKLGKHYLWITIGILLTIAIVMGLARILPPQETISDFIVLYAANLGVIQRVPIYDTPALTSLAVSQFNLASDFTLFPHPYPPWFSLSTFFLGYLPPKQAFNAWMLLNAAMLLVSAAILTIRWKPIPRLLTIMAVLIFIPSIGLIMVGQYSAPVLLGAVLFVYAVRREDAPLTAVGLLLITFKPHLGLFLLPAGFFWLVFQKTPFARRAIWMTLAGGIILAALGFIADPTWPFSYVRSLISYTTIPGVASRDLSASFSAFIVKTVLGYGSGVWSTWLSLFIIAILLLVFWRFKLYSNPETLMVGCALLTLLGDPYLFNYDYVLILLPLMWLARQVKSTLHRIMLGVVYFVPWLSLILERNANIFYSCCAILLLILLIQSHHNKQKLVSN